MLKYKIAKLEDVEEKFREFYESRDGAFFLKVEGAADKAKVDEFRENNITLKQQLDALAAKFDGIDLEEAKAALKEKADARTKKMIDGNKVEELLAERTASMKTEFEKQLKAANDKLAAQTAQLEKLVVDNGIQSEALKAGVRDTAMEDVLLRGRMRFKVQDGKAVPMTPDGKVIYGKDGTTPESISDWLAGLSANASHLFQPSTGGGAKPGAGNLPPGTKTMKRADFDALDPDAKHAFVTTDKGKVVD